MLHFTQNFTHYLQCEVVEPNWHVLERELDQATNADELIAAHDRFLDQCMKEGMLFWPKILKRLDRIKAACLRFAAATAAFARAAEEALASARNELRRADPDPDPDDPDDPDAAKRKSRAVRHGDRRAAEAEAVESAARRSGFAEATASLSEAFDAQFGTLLETLNDAAHLEPNLASLCARLDFNEYYSFGPGGKYHGA
jgi:gamma-tubulin complex component 2